MSMGRSRVVRGLYWIVSAAQATIATLVLVLGGFKAADFGQEAAAVLPEAVLDWFRWAQGQGRCAILSWKLKRLQPLWCDGVARHPSATDESFGPARADRPPALTTFRI
jgi:hypothetical protein